MGHTTAEYRGWRLRRARVVGAIGAAVAIWAWMGSPSSDAATSPDEQAAERVVVVAEGDTLWDLARNHAAEGVDRREWIAHVAERNDVRPQYLRPGDILRVPAP